MLDVTTATVSTANVPQAASSVKGTQDDLMRIRVSHLRAGERGPLVSCHRMPPSLGWAAGTGGEWMAGHDAAVSCEGPFGFARVCQPTPLWMCPRVAEHCARAASLLAVVPEQSAAFSEPLTQRWHHVCAHLHCHMRCQPSLGSLRRSLTLSGAW